jgi:F0F1-type ATP synthase assembly protein I
MNKWSPFLLIMVVGWYVALSMLIPTAIGYWLDTQKFGTFPWLTVTGLILGTVVMVFGVYRMIKQVKVSMDSTSKDESGLKNG